MSLLLGFNSQVPTPSGVILQVSVDFGHDAYRSPVTEGSIVPLSHSLQRSFKLNAE